MRSGILRLILVATAALAPVAVRAQSGQPGATPRDAMTAFLRAGRAGDWAGAGRYLDLRRVEPAQRERVGQLRAKRLKELLDRQLWVDLESLSDEPTGDLDDGLPRGRESIGAVELEGATIDIILERSAGRGARPDWRVSAATLQALSPALDRRVWVEDALPAWLLERRPFEIALWQWAALPALALGALGLAWLLLRLYALCAALVLRRPLRPDGFLAAARAPALLLLAVFLFSLGERALGLAVPAEAVLAKVALVVGFLAFVWLGFRLLDRGAQRLRADLLSSRGAAAASLVPLGARLAKFALATLALLALAGTLGLNVTGLVAGLGVGGLAVALAGQKTVENLFGGATLLVDQPVRVGDFCRFGDRIGTVEQIGLRSTRVRTLDRTLVTVPNSEFSTLSLENYAARDRIWMRIVIGLRYETSADQLRHVMQELRQLFHDHPQVAAKPARVRFIDFGAYSLDIEVFAYLDTRDYDESLAIREDLLLSIMDVVADAGTSFAFPSQTIYRAHDNRLDDSKASAVAAGIQGR
jgi:MscS family membrane protein